MRLLGQVLQNDAALADLQRRRERELILQLRLHRALPPALATHVSIADARSQELQLVAASGAAAALLRQRAPDVLHKLAGEGWEFTGIRVRVQARPAATSLEALASRLGYEPLAKALRRLARHAPHRARSDDDQPLEGVKDQDAQQ